MIKLTKIMMIILFTNNVCGGFFDQEKQGWFWYEVTKREEKKQKPKQAPKQSYTQQFENIQKALKESLHRALLSPTPSHVAHYQHIQKLWMEKSAQFSKVWQQNLIRNIALDDMSSNPTAQWARPLYYKKTQAKEDMEIKSIRDRIGLFFIFDPKCPYAVKMASMLNKIKKTYGIEIIGFKTQKGEIHGFPAELFNENFPVKITTSTTLIAVDPKTKQIYTLTKTMESFENIRGKLLTLSEVLRK